MLVFAAIMPHPPESIPGIGSEEDFLAIHGTMKAFDELRAELEKADPKTLIIISPHAQLEAFSFAINASPILSGNLHKFDLDLVQEYQSDIDFADKLAFAGTMCEVPSHLHEGFLDHGAIIPLYHLLKNIKPRVVHLSFSLMDYQKHYRYGQVIKSLIDKGIGGRVAVIASGDLSHRLSENSPSGYSPEAQRFDQDIIRYLGSNDIASIVNLHEDIARQAAECGMRSIMILLGMLHGIKYNFKLLSYESPFGVGYLTARLV